VPAADHDQAGPARRARDRLDRRSRVEQRVLALLPQYLRRDRLAETDDRHHVTTEPSAERSGHGLGRA
jgi:hypothetical protein